jgi:hypothetical protein
MSDNDTTPVITISPDPPTQGQSMEITYTGTPGTTLNIEWTPDAQPTSVTIGPDGKAKITVPSNATAGKITDPTPNGALAKSFPVDTP